MYVWICGNALLDLQCLILFYIIFQYSINSKLSPGECLGLHWRDFNFEENTFHIERNGTYTKMSGIVVTLPKTPCSVRAIPLMGGVKYQLLQLHHAATIHHPNTVLLTASVFAGKESPFLARDPNTATRKVREFMNQSVCLEFRRTTSVILVQPSCLRTAQISKVYEKYWAMWTLPQPSTSM